jgi:hypothetical protein
MNADVVENLKALKFVETIRSLNLIKMNNKRQDIAVTIAVAAWFILVVTLVSILL